MSFTVPTFNIMCNIYRQAALPPNPPAVVVACNLAWGRRVHQTNSGFTVAVMELLLPAHTDIRGHMWAGPADVVEVPAGTGRWYGVAAVDDAGRGFTNEHRIALIAQTAAIVPWPAPYP